jgi:hypothetical protein
LGLSFDIYVLQIVIIGCFSLLVGYFDWTVFGFRFLRKAQGARLAAYVLEGFD